VRAAAARWEGNQLALFELALTVQRAEGGPAADDDQQLLVGMVDVKRKARAAWW
jgi:hypothetical protein